MDFYLQILQSKAKKQQEKTRVHLSEEVRSSPEECRAMLQPFTGASGWYCAGGSATDRDLNHPTTRKSPASVGENEAVLGVGDGGRDGRTVTCCFGVACNGSLSGDVSARLPETSRGSSRDEWMSARVLLTSPAAERYWTKECSAGSLFK